MAPSETAGAAGAGRARWWAVVALFFANGAAFSSWFPRLPEVRERLGLSLGELGTVLVGIGLGGLVASVVAGALVDRLGSRRAAVGALVVLGSGLPALGLASSAIVLTVALVLLSAVDAVADIAMNVQAAAVQQRSERSVVQGFHAAWSIGTVAGAVSGTACAALDVSLAWQLAATGVVMALLACWARPALVPGVGTPDDRVDGSRRAPVVALLAVTAVVVAMVEGTPGDWAAVFASEAHQASDGVAGSGFVALSAGMVAGRLGGDRATDHLGERRLFLAALGVVGLGLGVVVTSPVVALAVVGFGVVGCGASVLFPTLYLRAATTPGVPAGVGVGLMSSGARLGFLASPPAVGALSEATSLRFGLAVVIGAAALAAVAASSATHRATLRRAGR